MSYNYNEPKVKKQSFRRYWYRLSSLQRSLVCLVLITTVICLIYLWPSLFQQTKSESFGRDSGLPQPPPMFNHVINERSPNEDFAALAVKNVKQEALLVAQNRSLPRRRGPPKLLRPNKLKDSNSPEDKAAENLGAGAKTENKMRQEAVKAAFKHAWSAYKKYAWGYDELKPISKTYHTWFGIGLTILDSLDTMHIMGLHDELAEAREWVAEKLTFDVNRDVNLFECTIRALGGLLSAYYLTNDELYLNKAKDLGERLLPAFKSSSPVPYSDVNLQTHIAHSPPWGPDSSTSEVTTIQLEFRYLSHLTGDDRFKKAVDEVTNHVHTLPKKDGLVPIFINANSGHFRHMSTITLGARGDSYYEYLLKMWIQSGRTDEQSKKDYLESVEGVKKHLMRESQPNKLLYFGELLSGENFSPKMDHLVCFMAGALALGAENGLPEDHYDIGQRLLDTCHEMYQRMPTGLSPEIVHFNVVPTGSEDLIVKPADTHNLLRPETVESLFYFYRLTSDKKYRTWGWRIFEAFEKYTKLQEGYTAINNVKNDRDPGYRNEMATFWFAETLKYFYLLFSDDADLLPLNRVVFNTEGHPFPILDTTGR